MQLLDDSSPLNKSLRKEYANSASFAALTPVGRVITWGNFRSGAISNIADQVQGLASSVTQIYSCSDGYTALRSDGTAISWRYGQFTTINAETPEKKIRSVSSTFYAFAALRADGSVVAWGDGSFGGDSSSIKENIASGVKEIYSNSRAFAALKTDGSVVTWGDSSSGGDNRLIAESLKDKVAKIYSTDSAFAALKSDGSVVTWGDIQRGGNSSAKSSFLASGVREIYSTSFAFAALKTDGSVVTWGGSNGYGGADSSQVAANLQNNVKWIYANGGAFAALKSDGSVVTWGDPNAGGNSSVALFNGAKWVYTNYADQLRSGVEKIFSTNSAFAALKRDGSVVTWGMRDDGGNSFLNTALQSGVIDIAATGSAFAALKSDGSVFTWGDSSRGGDSSNVRSLLSSGIQKIYANGSAFAALRSDGTVVTWGLESDGGQPSITKYKSNGVPFQESLPTSLSGIANIAEASSDNWLEFPVAPASPAITSVGGSDSVVSSQSNDKAVFGTAIAGVTVTIKSGSITLGKTSANASGVFSYGLTADNLTMLGQGTGKSITATASDSAGNTSAASNAFGFAIQTTPIIRGNSLYTIVDGPSWTQAEANSVKLGGHLISINSKDESSYVTSEFSKPEYYYDGDSLPQDPVSYTHFWLGATYSKQNNQWKWIDNSSWGFAQYMPNSYTDQNDYHLRTIFNLPGSYSSYTAETGFWWTGETTQPTYYSKEYMGISEIPFIRRGDSAYLIVQGPTWKDAEANAVKLGGHLVTINDSEENDWVVRTFDPLVSGNSWIGFTDSSIEGEWRWSDGTTSSYSNWHAGEPNNAAINGYGDEDYAALGLTVGDEKWNDWGGNGLVGIAEIKLAPNSKPTGNPTLSGTFKAGQVITIDDTPIQDADNFTGYTPNYNYSFEVSNDNGTNWTKLTSADATDNNRTYTLTSAEVGKQVRGIVSYLDGYGTQEFVASAISTSLIAPYNTAPTADHTLTGMNKVGRVLTADKSTIVDPDGVPGAVSYGWEVSSNGTTWTRLTSADATDNNSTYSLTAADLGKTIRSVISYTDNSGTNEVVNSAPTSAVVGNSRPTSIRLSTASIVENVGSNATAARLTSVDADTDDAFTYSLVSGTGSTDNGRFSIAGDRLVIASNPDFETKNSYSIRVRTTDRVGAFIDKTFVMTVSNVNEAPTAISLSNSNLIENTAAGSVIANLSSIDPERETVFAYSLTPNSGSAILVDNQYFTISGNQLKINAAPNFEQKDSYSISVRSTDAGKLFYDQILTLVVQDEDEAPTSISITGAGINENSAVGSVVGELITTDQDESSTEFEYELIAGATANNNNLFEMNGNQLKANATFNFEAKSAYVVNVRTTDEAGLTFDTSITIKVNNVNENPTDLTVSATAFNENLAIGSTVATLGFVDPDKTGTYTYSLVSGIGDKDNQAFLITGNALKVNVATNFEIQKSYAVRLRVTDQGGLFFEKSVAFGVNNLVEKITSAVSTILALDKDTIELTGAKNNFGIGNQFDNTITGNTGKNKLTGGLGKDILTGGAGVDTFFYNDTKESLLSGFDVITDYAAGEKINVGISSFEGDDLIASTGKVSALNADAIGSVLTNTTFLANNAAAFTVEGLTGTFLALNDGRDGFQADSDALIHLSKYTIGSKTPISII